jgi:alkylation response protein AidB-like acyl-CoA dehydrogenase
MPNMASHQTLDPVASGDGTLTELIDQQLHPNVVRIDTEGFYPEAFLRQLGAIGGFKHHVLAAENMPLAINTMAQVGRFCGSTAFLIWCHDACLWYLSNTRNQRVRERFLEPVMNGIRLGATALSNPMKHFSGIEELRLTGKRVSGGYRINGSLPWVSNLASDTVFACIFDTADEPVMSLVECGTKGLQLKRTAQFAALEGTATYSLRFDDVFVADELVLANPAKPFIRSIRSGFILLQVGIGLGIIQGAIDDIQTSDRSLFDSNRYLPDRPGELMKELTLLQAETELLGRTPLDLAPESLHAVMRLRLRSAELASRAAQSALLHAGARGFIVSSAPQRRIREAMFYSILTPSIKHLRKELS